jgi:L-asparaginase II
MSNGEANPVLVDVWRGALIESRHRGAVAIADADGRLLLALGDTMRPVFPRSAVKLMQAIPLVESGAADAFGLGDSELAIACASHSGDAVHVETVRRLLAEAGASESMLVCGTHWPMSERAARELTRNGRTPSAIHNNCSGKHAGMVATALHLGLRPQGYGRPDHPVQTEIARVISEICGVALTADRTAIDGCSVPTFALPLAALATGFARLARPAPLARARRDSVGRLMQACFAEPLLVAGEGRFDTIVMQSLAPTIFAKGGAEGVHCAALSELGLGIALKIDDGTKRGTEAILAHVLAAVVPEARGVLAGHLSGVLRNWRGIEVGRLRPSVTLDDAIAALAPRRDLARNGMVR